MSETAATPVSCANGACAKHIDLEAEQANILCPLCASPDTVYCSEACRMIDWVGHKCDNAFLISAAMGQKQATLFVPYSFEDTLDAKEHKQWVESLTPAARIEAENQHYLVQVNHPDQTVSQHLIRVGGATTFRHMDPKLETAFRRGRPPIDEVLSAKYRIKVTVNNKLLVVMEGDVGERAIYDGHQPPGTEMGYGDEEAGLWKKFKRTVSRTFMNVRKESSDTVLFVRPKDTDYVTMPQKGNISIQVQISNGLDPSQYVTVTEMTGPYAMPAKGREASRFIGKFLHMRLKALFPDKADNIKDLKTLRAIDTDGHTEMILVFEVPRQKTATAIGAKMAFRGLIYQVYSEHVAEEAHLKGASLMKSGESTPPPPPPVFPDEESPPPPPPPYDAEPGSSGAGQEEGEKVTPTTVIFAPEPKAELGVPPPPPPPVSVPGRPVPDRQDGGVSPGASRNVVLKTSPRSEKSSFPSFPGINPANNAAFTRAMKAREVATQGGEEEEEEENDPEWNTPVPSRTAITFPLRCDASDLSQMVGLAMALELRERDLPAHAAAASALVRNHARALMEKRIEDPSVVPMDVSAAVYNSIQTLHELPVHQ